MQQLEAGEEGASSSISFELGLGGGDGESVAGMMGGGTKRGLNGALSPAKRRNTARAFSENLGCIIYKYIIIIHVVQY